MKKEIPDYGVDSVSGKDEGSNPSGANDEVGSLNESDESNYPHIEEFVKGLAHPHELHHAMYHAAKRLADEDAKTVDKPVTMDDYQNLKKPVD